MSGADIGLEVRSDPSRTPGPGAGMPSTMLRGPARPDLLRDEVLAEIFATSARERADHPALIDGAGNGRRLTYAEVDGRADAIARGLAARGIGPGDVVGLWMARGVDLLVAQIGIAKSGAAWLPFDAEAPADRIAVCLGDAAAKALLVSADLVARAPSATPVVTPEGIAIGEGAPVDVRAKGLTPSHPAYLIYTSGSTGVPKGIVITQANICHFLRSANALYGMRADDVVFQGASVAFDLSMEEIWIPYLVGATLFVASPAMMGDAERLPDILDGAGITVLDTVPTLLGLLTRDVPSLRLVLLGGEALPQPLVARWATAGRQLFNTYGPTEATVVATAIEMRPGEIVTIGRPIANYTTYIVDEALRPVAPGVQGELLIGGPGVAQGYLQRPELTAEKFVENPFDGAAGDLILYRSGDAVSLDGAGNIVFHGRIDDQVKVRGFRVELGEIEARIQALPGIGQAAVVLRQDDGVDRLVAFLVMDPGREVDRGALRGALAKDMPPYMVPSHFEGVAVLPRLISGKVDRKALRGAPLTPVESDGEQEEPRDETEAALLAAAKSAFGNQAIPFEADFFADLGGHSLIAARFVSAVRQAPALASITLQDVYAQRTLRAMSETLIARTGGAGAETAVKDLSFAPPPLSRRFLCGLAQAVALPFVIALATSQWLGIFVTYLLLTGGGLGFFGEMGVLLAVYIGINIVTGTIAIAAKWLILGRTKPGRYPLWGAYYFRWWLVQRLNPLVHVKWLQGSPAIRLYLTLLGAKVGRDALISDIEVGAPDLLSIGDGASLGGRLVIANAEVVGNELVIGPVTIGADVATGTSCVIGHGTTIGDHAELADLTTVPAGTIVGARERWDGSPGRKVGTVEPDATPPAEASPDRRAAFGLAYALLLGAIPAVGLLPIFPAFYIFDQLSDTLGGLTDLDYHWYLPALTWPTSMLMTAGTVLLIALIRWAILPRAKSGTYSVFSGFYLRKWTVALATEVTLETLSSLFATVYMRAWYRLMGARIGHGAEISTNLAGRYDLTEIGANNFIADEVVYGEEEIRRGHMHLEPVRTGARVFVGNDAVVAPGAIIPDDVLIGIKSKPPANDRMGPGETWFGSPPIKLPTRQKVSLASGPGATFEPGRWPRVRRGLFEAFSTSFSPMLFITLAICAIDFYFYPAILAQDWSGLAVSFVAASVAIALIQCICVIAVKWLLMGRYKPTMQPMWSFWAMRTEAVAVLYWGLMGKVLLEHLMGTPFLPWMLRLLGVRIGKGVCMLTTDITEFDCVEIGDYCTINRTSALQTHLYEDRVMKIGKVTLGRGVSVGAFATVLYETHVGDYARLRPLTIVMKGESIPASSEWEGAPAVPVIHVPAETARAA